MLSMKAFFTFNHRVHIPNYLMLLNKEQNKTKKSLNPGIWPTSKWKASHTSYFILNDVIGSC